MWPFTRDPNKCVTRFWRWFVKYEEALYRCDDPHSPLIADLLARLQRVHPVLTWQFGGEPGVERREFAVSADGIREGFDSVEALVDAAPRLRYFDVVRFRPPIPDGAESTISMNGITIDATETMFRARLDKRGLIDLLVFVPECPEFDDQNYLHLVFILLDGILGEYGMECRIGEVHVVASDDERAAEVERRPLSELRSFVTGQTV
jgi:hypothetical protein